MTLLSGAAWAVTDDAGTGQSGTIFDAAWVDAIEASINALIHSATNPTITPEDIIDEVVLARNGSATLLAAVQAANSTSYLTGASDLGATWVISQRSLQLKHANVAHGMTTQIATDVFGSLREFTTGFGGILLNGYSEGDNVAACVIGYSGSGTPTAAAVEIRGAKKSGTTITDIAATEPVFRVRNNATLLATVYGDGGVSLLTGLKVGFISGTLDDDSVAVGDANFKLRWTATESQLAWDTNDQLIYVRSSNILSFYISSGVAFEVNSAGIKVQQAVGFTMSDTQAAVPAVLTLAEKGSDPAAPAANNVHVYSRDNGAGKTQLVARFPTGAIQQIAIEP